MWQRLKNFISSLTTYNVLSPDLKVRRQVNRLLSDRPALTIQEWYEAHGKPCGISYPAMEFAYTHLERYSGVRFARMLPGDRLEEDLHWTRVCWFDWEILLCEDFWQQFQVDISDRLEEDVFMTVEDLIQLLDDYLPPEVHSVSSHCEREANFPATGRTEDCQQDFEHHQGSEFLQL